MLARPHPVFGSWCFCKPGDSQRLLDKQLQHRDQALQENPEHSGMPPSFEEWCRVQWLPSHINQPYYKAQAQQHVAALALQISNLQGQIEKQAGALLDERDRLIQERIWLTNEIDNAGDA